MTKSDSFFAFAATVVVLLLSCATTRAPADRIPTLVHDWFVLLESPEAEPADFEAFLAGPDFELMGNGERRIDVAALSARHRELHSTYVQVAHRIEGLRVEPSGERVYTADFEVERTALDAEGIPHLERRRASWRVRAEGHGDPVILGIDERPLLPYPGSGPRIVCY